MGETGKAAETVKIDLGNGPIDLSVVVGTEQEKGIDVTRLREKTGYITLDPGYVNTGACLSKITFIDGDKGILRYRGIPIEQLAEKSTFLETAYLVMFGKLPTAEQLQKFTREISSQTYLHEDLKAIFHAFTRDAHPMGVVGSVMHALAAVYENESGNREELFYLNSVRLLAQFPTLAAFAYKRLVGQPFMYPDHKREYCENFLHMMFALPTSDYQPEKEVLEALNLLLILHVDHEQNCSTSTVRLVASSLANLQACIAAGISALWGSRHGGANQEVIEMLETIRQDGGNVQRYVELAKDKNSSFRLMGFGHRVYKNFDPRAKIIKTACDKLLNKLEVSDPLLDIARELEAAALKDSYFIERKLYPNVDFYSGIMYKAMGIPVNFFTVMFALGRLPGWIAHAKELLEDPTNKIGRPRQVYVGPALNDYIPVQKRS
jgi:citrate synthase